MEREINITAISDDECTTFDHQRCSEPFQCAQNPLERFTEELLKIQSKPKLSKTDQHKRHRKIKSKINKRIDLENTNNNNCGAHSFVINSTPTKGLRLIQIQVTQLDDSQPNNHCVSDNSVLLSSQYVVKDISDEIMDQTEKIISNISKKICGYSYTSYF